MNYLDIAAQQLREHAAKQKLQCVIAVQAKHPDARPTGGTISRAFTRCVVTDDLLYWYDFPLGDSWTSSVYRHKS
jgi:hypothetical protein